KADATIARGFDRRARGRGVIDALVRADGVQNRMTARGIEVRADAPEVERRAQELPVHAAALGREITVDLTVRRRVMDRAMNLTVVDEFGGHDAPIAEVAAVAVLLFVDQVEAIARPDIEREVDLPPEDVVRELQDGFRADAGGAGRNEQGRVDRPLRSRRPDLDRRGDDVRGEAAGGARHRQDFRFADAVVQRLHRAVIVNHGDFLARPDLIQRLTHPGQVKNRGQVVETEPEPAEDSFQRVVAPHGEIDFVATRFWT